MEEDMHIENCLVDDVPFIIELYSHARNLQRSKKEVVVWPQFDRKLIETEVRELRQWKLVHEGKIICVWATTISDPQIWGERGIDPALYIHRIAAHPDFRGRNFISLIVEWAKIYASRHAREYIRLDTMGRNYRLIEYYTRAGFRFLGMFDLGDTSGLPEHYQNGQVCLFEIALKS